MSAPIANGWPSKAEFTRQVLVAGQVSIRMKFAEAFSSEHIKRHINSLLICLCLAKLCMEISIHFCHPHHDQSETPAILHSEILDINRYESVT